MSLANWKAASTWQIARNLLNSSWWIQTLSNSCITCFHFSFFLLKTYLGNKFCFITGSRSTCSVKRVLSIAGWRYGRVFLLLLLLYDGLQIQTMPSSCQQIRKFCIIFTGILQSLKGLMMTLSLRKMWHVYLRFSYLYFIEVHECNCNYVRSSVKIKR